MKVVDYSIGLTREHIYSLSEWLRPAVLAPVGMKPMPLAAKPAELAQDFMVRVVFVTLSCSNSSNKGAGNHVTASAMALGICAAAEKALLLAMQQAEVFAHKLQSFQLDVVTEAMPIDSKVLQSNELVVADPSLLGVALGDFNQAWLAEESLRYGLITGTRGINFDAVAEHLAGRIKTETLANVPEKVWCFLTSARYVGRTEEGFESVGIFRGHREHQALSKDIARERALVGANYLARAVRADGSFVYQYESGLNKEAADYNMVRHAGTLWSMLDMLANEKDAERAALLRSAIDRAAAYLRGTIEVYAYGTGLVVNEFDTAKLGGNGLALVALTDYYRLAPSTELLDELRGLAIWIVESQASDGEYASHKVELSTGEVSRFLSDYYPGEAILGLMRLYKIDPDPKWQHVWKDSAVAATRWLIHVRDKGKELADLEHDHWLLYAINEVYRVEPDADFLAHTRLLVEAIVTTQLGSARGPNAAQPDWHGGWYEPPRTTPVACRVEGLMAAVTLLREVGEPDETKALLVAVEAGLKFMLQNQLYGEKLLMLPNPARAKGGFHSDFNNWHVRIDFVQHSISALMAYARS